MEEKLLIARAAKGDISSFETLIRQYQNKIYALCLRMTGNEADAEDAAQECLLKVYRSISGFGGRASFGSWVYQVAKNTSIDLIRKRREIPLEEEFSFLPAKCEFEPEAQLLSSDMKKKLYELIATLSNESREVLMLRDIDGFSYEEIANLLGIEYGTVKSRLFRAREKLRKLIQKAELL